jgi:hypothetical protein
MQSQLELNDRSGSQLVGASWLIEQWLQDTTPPDPNCNAIDETATPSASHGQALPPAKRRRTDGWTTENDAGSGDLKKTCTAKSVVSEAPSLSGTALTPTTRPDLKPKRSGPVASSLSVGEPSVARSVTSGTSGSTAQRSKSRSTGPVKTTTALSIDSNLDKPVRFLAMAENAVAQLPADVRGLYKRVRNIVVHHEAFMPLSIREDIDSAAGCRHRETWFYHDAGMLELSDTRRLDSEAAGDATDNDHGDDKHGRSP